MTEQATIRMDDALVPIHLKVDVAQRISHHGGVPVMERTDGFTELSRQEFEKGVRVGILMVKDLPAAQVEFLEEQLREMRQQMEAESGGSES